METREAASPVDKVLVGTCKIITVLLIQEPSFRFAGVSLVPSCVLTLGSGLFLSYI